MNDTNKRFFLILFCLCLFLSFVNLSKWAFNDADEATYAQVYHESSLRNNFSTFTYLKSPWFEKPPLYFWSMRLSALIFGENEFSLRLPSSVMATISVLLVYLIVLELTKDSTAAFLSSIVLLTTAYFWFSGRQVRMDVPVTFSILFSFYAFLRAKVNPRWFLVFGLGVTTGILFKSVIGLLAYVVIIFYSLIYKEWSWLKNKWFWIGNLFTLILIAPWHIYQTLLFGKSFWNSYFLFHIADRITSNVVVGSQTPFLYELGQLFIVNQPWFLVFVILGLLFLLNLKDKFTKHKFETFSLLASVSILTLFCIPQTKLLYYFVPMLPFIAMFIGSTTLTLLKRYRKTTLVIFCILFIIGFANTVLKIFSQKDRDFFLQETGKISRILVAEDERKVAQIAAKEKLNLYLYNWNFYTTLIYYSILHGGVNIQKYTSGLKPKSPYLILIPTPIFGNLKIAKDHIILFQSEAGVLIKIN